jgi:hypothetical protein
LIVFDVQDSSLDHHHVFPHSAIDKNNTAPFPPLT